MRTRINILLVVQLFLFYSCGVDRVYTSGTYGSLKSYTAKPFYNGEKSSAFYLSADVSSGKHEQELGVFKDSKTLVSVNSHRSVTRRNYNLHYGLGATYGCYKFNRGIGNLISEDQKESFYSFNFKTGINYTMSRRKIDYRFLGLELGYNYEFGPYQNRIKELKNFDGDLALLIVDEKSMFSYNLNSECIFKLKDDNSLSLGVFFGSILVNTDKTLGEDALFGGFTLGLGIDRTTFSSVIEHANEGIRSAKFGVTYQLF